MYMSVVSEINFRKLVGERTETPSKCYKNILIVGTFVDEYLNEQ